MRFVAYTFFNSERQRELKLSKLFSVAVISVSYLAGQVSVVAAKYGSIVIAISTVTAVCLLNVNFSSSLQMCAS